MATKATIEIDTKPLDRLIVNAFQIHGEAILFGIPEPAPPHVRKGVPGISTAFLLARVEFGPPRKASSPSPSAKRKKKRHRRLARSLLRKILRGFRGRGRTTPRTRAVRVPTSPKGERPVIRWVAATQRDVMRDGFKAAAKHAIRGGNPRPDLEVLGGALAKLAQDRMTAVGAVDTGQTRAAITHKIVRRYGPR